MRKYILRVLMLIIILMFCVFINKVSANVWFEDTSGKKITSIEVYLNEPYTFKVCCDPSEWVYFYYESYYDNAYVDVQYKTIDGDGFMDSYFEWLITLTGKQVGHIEYKVKETYTLIFSGTDTYTLPVKIRKNPEVEAAERAQKENEELLTFWTKSISELTTAEYKLKYLMSILYNDQINGNTNLWDKFVNETTPEQRKGWQREITLNWRDSREQYQSAIDALGAQIALDDKKITEEELEEVKQEAGQTQEQTKKENDEFVNRIFAQYDISPPRVNVPFVDVLENIDKYVPTTSEDGIEQLTGKVNIILTIISSIGMVVAVLMLAIIGIKYMLGSVEEKAEYKKDMIPYLVGAVLIFGICAITKVLQQFGESINNI